MASVARLYSIGFQLMLRGFQLMFARIRSHLLVEYRRGVGDGGLSPHRPRVATPDRAIPSLE
jgi:hypothetical protein